MRTLAAAVAALACTVPGLDTVHAQSADSARAQMVDRNGDNVGEVVLIETAGRGVLLEISLFGLAEGRYAIHLHEAGHCLPPSFESAGGHYDPGSRAHGFLHADGRHAGDLLNLRATSGGELRTERHAAKVTLRAGEPNTLFDEDGTAIVVHAEADDYRSQPSGDAGHRLYCGVVRR